MREREFEYRRPGDPGRAYEERGYERGGGFGGDAIWYRQGYGSDDGPFVGKGPRGYQRSDERIFDDVCERLAANGRIDATNIDVDVLRGVVTLTGSVDDRRQKRLAEETIESVAGVKDIENQLRLSSYGEDKERRDDRPETRGDERRDAIGIASAARDRDDERRDETRDREAVGIASSRERTDERLQTDERLGADDRLRADDQLRTERASPDLPLSGDFGRTGRTEKPADLDTRLVSDKTAQYEAVAPDAIERQAARADEPGRDTLAPDRAKDDVTTADRIGDRQPVGVMQEDRERVQAIDSAPPTQATAASGPSGSVGAPAGVAASAAAAPSVAAAPSPTPAPQGGNGRSEVSDGEPRVETREIRLTTGAPVYSNEGEKIGEVAEASGEYFVVHKGLIFASELYIPADAIVRADENGVQVNIPKDRVGNYKERPVRAAVS